MFAYINSDECYGTLYEIGYAKALGKPVLIVFDNGQRCKKMWFINGDIVRIAGSLNILKNTFEKIIKDYLSKKSK